MIWIWLIGIALAGDELPPAPDSYPEWAVWAALIGAVTAGLGGIAKALLVAAAAFNDLRAEVVAARAEQEGMLKLVTYLDEKGKK